MFLGLSAHACKYFAIRTTTLLFMTIAFTTAPHQDNNYGAPYEPESNCKAFKGGALPAVATLKPSCKSCGQLTGVMVAFISCTLCMYILLPLLAHVEKHGKFEVEPDSDASKPSLLVRVRGVFGKVCCSCLGESAQDDAKPGAP